MYVHVHRPHLPFVGSLAVATHSIEQCHRVPRGAPSLVAPVGHARAKPAVSSAAWRVEGWRVVDVKAARVYTLASLESKERNGDALRPKIKCISRDAPQRIIRATALAAASEVPFHDWIFLKPRRQQLLDISEESNAHKRDRVVGGCSQGSAEHPQRAWHRLALCGGLTLWPVGDNVVDIPAPTTIRPLGLAGERRVPHLASVHANRQVSTAVEVVDRRDPRGACGQRCVVHDGEKPGLTAVCESVSEAQCAHVVDVDG
eukprot:scaffold294850_cov26-Tisochrysis_lutea.AAC.2